MRVFLLTIFYLTALSVLEYRCVSLIQQGNLAAEVDVAAGVLAGRPYWKAYQNRLLGPGLVAGASRLTGCSLTSAYQGVTFALVALANAVALQVFSRLARRPAGAWAATVAYAALFVAFQDPEWLYLWDFVDLSTMVLFAGTVAATTGGGGRVPWPWLAALFAVELLNRESAQFIALWLVLDAFAWGRAPGTTGQVVPRRGVARPGQLVAGVVLGVAGALWTGFVRNALCVQETGVVPRAEIREFAGGQFFMLPVTLGLWREPPTLATAVVLVLLGGTGLVLWRAWEALGDRAWPVTLLVMAFVGANFCFAYVPELRVWLPLLPLLLCLADLGSASASGARALPAAGQPVAPEESSRP